MPANSLLPPPPIQDPTGSFAWLEWYRQLRNYVAQTGSIPWNIINFAGSNLSDIANRAHSVLQSLQGGSSGQYYHLTQAEHDKLSREDVIEYSTPSTGFSLAVANTTGVVVLNPAAGLATGTITMPAIPVNNQVVSISSTKAITTLTHNPNSGQTLNGGLTTLAANGFGSWVYRSTDTSWYRIG